MDILNALGVVPPVVIAQIVSLGVLIFFVSKYLFGPIDTIMRQRQEEIANSLSGAESQRQQAESLRLEYEAHLSKIADEARERMDQAMKDAEAARQRVLEQAHAEIRELHERQQTQLELERERLRRELRAEMADIAALTAAKALRGQMTPEMQTAINDHIIAELDKLPVRQTM